MPITFDTLKSAIKHTLGGEPSQGASYARIINGAGRAWTSAQDWYYLSNREATLTATPNSEWIALPTDYQSYHQLLPDGDGYATLAFITPAEFVDVREAGILGSTSSFLCTIVHRNVDGEVLPWLRLYPTPTFADTFTLLYDAQWGDVNDDDDVIPIPSFAEHAFEEWVKNYARGLEEEDIASLGDRMAAVKASFLFTDVARRDALTTGAVISPGQGAAQSSGRRYVRFNHQGNVV